MGEARRDARLKAATGVVASFVLLGAACGPDPSASGGDPTNAAGSTDASTGSSGTSGSTETGSTGTSTEASPRIRPTVEPPGPLDEPQAGDDLLIVSDETLPEELVDQIEAIEVNGKPGVAAAELFSIGQFAVESKWYDVAAIDPEGFRRFAQEDMTFHDQWNRVAGGEIALVDTMQDRLPLDEEGYLDVGTGEEVHEIHVGAWSRYQVGSIDALVNTGWGEELGLTEDNALLLSTGTISPQAVREQIEKLAPDLSITALDIVAQTGIDPDTYQNVVPVGTYKEAVGVFRYTPIGGGRVAPDPAWVKEYIVTDTVPLLGRLTCNKYMMPQLKGALAEIVSLGLSEEIKYHVGCYYPRFISGTTTLSNHSFGLAIDINSLENQRGTVGEMHPTVVEVFKKWGFAWGGDWGYTDPMHFELQEIVEPGG